MIAVVRKRDSARMLRRFADVLEDAPLPVRVGFVVPCDEGVELSCVGRVAKGAAGAARDEDEAAAIDCDHLRDVGARRVELAPAVPLWRAVGGERAARRVCCRPARCWSVRARRRRSRRARSAAGDRPARRSRRSRPGRGTSRCRRARSGSAPRQQAGPATRRRRPRRRRRSRGQYQRCQPRRDGVTRGQIGSFASEAVVHKAAPRVKKRSRHAAHPGSTQTTVRRAQSQ